MNQINSNQTCKNATIQEQSNSKENHINTNNEIPCSKYPHVKDLSCNQVLLFKCSTPINWKSNENQCDKRDNNKALDESEIVISLKKPPVTAKIINSTSNHDENNNVNKNIKVSQTQVYMYFESSVSFCVEFVSLKNMFLIP